MFTSQMNLFTDNNNNTNYDVINSAVFIMRSLREFTKFIW